MSPKFYVSAVWHPHRILQCISLIIAVLASVSIALGQSSSPAPTDETVLGELLITPGQEEVRPRLAILPSLSPDLEDVIVRGVVRRDFELTGLFRLINDTKAPPGLYGFDDPVDVAAWRNIGAEVVVKVAARKNSAGDVEVYGLAYLLAAGNAPVYQKRIKVKKEQVRVTAHRITDALLGALTGREGGFASRMAFSSKYGRNHSIFTIDSDGHDLRKRTLPADTSLAPAWGPLGYLFYVQSKNYSPFAMMRLGEERPLSLPFKSSIYSLAFSPDGKRLALSVARPNGSMVYVGGAHGNGMRQVSKTDVASHPVFSPSGKLAWAGGDANHGPQRIYVEGKAVSPSAFSAASPAFCDTEDGIRLVYSVAVGGGRRDIVWSNESGKGTARLTQNRGSNTYPACSRDGRLLAFFSTRKSGAGPGLYVKSLKSFGAARVSGRMGQSLRWTPLPPQD